MVAAELSVALDRTHTRLVEQHSDRDGEKTSTTTTMERTEAVATDNEW